MTPNEKANELIEKFCNVIPIEANITDSVEEANRKLIADKRASVQCAIIAVEEIIKELLKVEVMIHPDFQSIFVQKIEFWNEVKQELENEL